MRVETVEVCTEDGKDRLIINKEDFNAEKHTLWSSTAIVLQVTPVADVGGDGQIVPELRTDGPTVAEYVSAGHDPNHYPPFGYSANSTPEEIAEAIEQYAEKSNPPPSVDKSDYLVTKAADGKKFIVIDKNAIPVQRDGIDASGYKTEKAAWDAVNAL